jgi:hypothetical protein
MILDVWDEKCASASPIFCNDGSFNLSLQKNKSAKVQKIAAQIQSEQSRAGKSPAMLAKEKEKELRAKEKAAEEKRKKGAVDCPRQPFLSLMRVIKRKQSYSSPFRSLKKFHLESVCGHLSRPKCLLIRLLSLRS